MKFHEVIRAAGVTPKEIIEKLGCPKATAYDWYDGRRSPPQWQWPTWWRGMMVGSLADFYTAKLRKAASS